MEQLIPGLMEALKPHIEEALQKALTKAAPTMGTKPKDKGQANDKEKETPTQTTKASKMEAELTSLRKQVGELLEANRALTKQLNKLLSAPTPTASRSYAEAAQGMMQNSRPNSPPSHAGYQRITDKPAKPRDKPNKPTQPPSRQDRAPSMLPLQPAAEAVERIMKEQGFTAVQPSKLYRCRTLKQVDPAKTPDTWNAQAQPDHHQSILLVGGDIHSLHAAASTGLKAHKEVHKVGAIVSGPHSTRGRYSTALKEVLTPLGRSVDSLDVEGSDLSIHVLTANMQWTAKDDSQGAFYPGTHSILLIWTKRKEGAAPQPVQETHPHPQRRLSTTEGTAKMVCSLDTNVVPLPADTTKARGWAREEVWRRISALAPGKLANLPPLTMGQRGSKIEVTTVLPGAAIHGLLRESGKQAGVEYRLFMDPSTPASQGPHAAHMVWLKLPEGKTGEQAWGLLAPSKEFAGILAGNQPGKIGVRIWGPHRPESRAAVENLLGLSPTLVTKRVRVRGYSISMGVTEIGRTSEAQKEADTIFGEQVVQVTQCHHMQSSGLVRPTFDLEVTGLPQDWTGQQIPAPDTRLPPRSWTLVSRQRKPTALKAVGRSTALPKPVLVPAPPPEPAREGQMTDETMEDDEEEVEDDLDVI